MRVPDLVCRVGKGFSAEGMFKPGSNEQELNSRRGEGSIPDREQHRQRVGGGLKEKNVGEADGGRPVCSTKHRVGGGRHEIGQGPNHSILTTVGSH